MSPQTRHLIRCRAGVADSCYDGQPTSAQFGENLPMGEDGTFNGESIVCDPCYLMLMPFTRSGQALHEELSAAIGHVRSALAYLHESANPAKDAADATRRASAATPGSPMHRSALASAALARAEAERRAS